MESAVRASMKTRRARAAASTKRTASGAGGLAAARRAADPQREREAARYAEPLPSRELILQTLNEEAFRSRSSELAQLLGVRRTEPRLSRAASRRWSATARSCATARARSASRPSSTSCAAASQGASRRLRFPRARRRRRRLFLAPRRDAQGAARRPRARARGRRRPPRPAARRGSSRCSSARTGRSSGGCTPSAASRSWSPRTGASARTS